jgi:hypothetical protein
MVCEFSEPTASTLVFYDWEGVLDRQAWLRLGQTFFALLNTIPNFAEYSRAPQKFQKVKFASLPRLFEKHAVESATLKHLTTSIVDVNLADVTCGFYEFGVRKRGIVFSHSSNAIDVDLFVGVIHELSRAVRITYGHAYLRPVRLGPVMYAYDLIYGLDQTRPEDADEMEQMVRWFNERLDMVVQKKPAPFRHLGGMQRDVYPLNVLTQPHLDRSVGGQPLEKWVAADGGRGRLWKVADGVWVWVVPPASLPFVQAKLASEGLLVSRVNP